MDRRRGLREPPGRNQDEDQPGRRRGKVLGDGVSRGGGVGIGHARALARLTPEAVEEGGARDRNESGETEQDVAGLAVAESEEAAGAGGELT